VLYRFGTSINPTESVSHFPRPVRRGDLTGNLLETHYKVGFFFETRRFINLTRHNLDRPIFSIPTASSSRSVATVIFRKRRQKFTEVSIFSTVFPVGEM
jgi:hypothetical protein